MRCCLSLPAHQYLPSGSQATGRTDSSVPNAHIYHSVLRDICQPVHKSGVFLHMIITAQIVPELFVGLQLRLGVQGFIRHFDGPERTYYFTIGQAVVQGTSLPADVCVSQSTFRDCITFWGSPCCFQPEI